MSQETVFDKILAKELPADVVYEDSDVLAFKDVNPVAPVHILVIPKKKVQSFAQVQEQEPQYLGRFVQAVAHVANICNLEEGYRVVFNHGTHGQQTVQYLHAHIIGGRQLNWPPC